MTAIPFKKLTLFLCVHTALLATLNAHAQDDVYKDAPSVTLDTITVFADSEYAYGPVVGVAPSSVGSLGFNESILEATQSVSVVGQQEIESIGADNLNEALGYTTGINVREPNDRTAAGNIIRGFRNLVPNRDGQKYQINIFDGQQELYGFERIEVVKGASSVLNGEVAPGGVVNLVTKKPFFDNAYEVNIEAGSFDHKKISTDINQQLTDEIAVRLVGVYQDSESFVDEVDDDITYIAPSLTWWPTKDTEITIQADYQNTKTKYVYGLPSEGTLRKSVHGKIDRETYSGNPEFDKYDNDRYTIGYEITHNVTPDLQIKHSLRKMDSDLDFNETRPVGSADNKTFTQASLKRLEESDVVNGNLSLKYDWSAGEDIDNTTLFGVDYYDAYHETARYAGAGGTINLYDPDYGKNNINADNINTPYPTASWTDDKKDIGVYLQNKLTYADKLVAKVGLLHSSLDVERAYYFSPDLKQTADYSETLGSLGLAYIMNNGVAPYASYSQSFEAELGADRAGNQFEPTEGEQYEFGVRYQPEGSDTLLTGAVYRIEQSNVLVADPENKGNESFKKQLGEVRSQGVELEAKTQIGENANLIAGYSYIDARTTKAGPLNPDDEGKRTENVPYNAFSLWGDYRFADYGLPQLKAGLGVRYTGETTTSITEDKVPNNTLVDLMASYDWSDNLKLSLNVKNLLDEEYVHCTYGCFYGEPRNVVGKVTYKW